MKPATGIVISRRICFESVAVICCLVFGLCGCGCSKKDADKETDDEIARMISKNPLKSGKVILALPADATPIERALHGKSPECYTCAVHGCADPLARSTKIEGVANDGPAKGKPKAELAQAAFECILKQSCVKNGASVNCYCGTAKGPDCISANANGPCKSELEAGLETTDPKRIAIEFTKDDTGGGAAMNLVLCLNKHRCAEKCF